MSDILDIVLRDEENIATETVPVVTEDSLAHYGRLGMKWYQHIYGEYQGAAKYAEKGARQVDRLQEKGKISEAKRLRKKVDKFLSIAEKEKELSAETKRKIAESVNEHSSDKEVQAAAKKIQKFEETSKASDAIIDDLRQDRINDLTRGVADWKKASSEDISAAITRLNLEKQYKEIRDDVSGAKVWKEAGVKALDSVAGSSGKILEEIIKSKGNIAEKRNEADIAAEKDARTWNREDEKYARDRKDKLAEQAREDRNAELKAQRDIAKEEAKNRADYLNAQTAAAKLEWDKEKQNRTDRLADEKSAAERESDNAIREVLEGKRSESSLTSDQAKRLGDYVDRMFSGTKNTRQVLDDNENARQQQAKVKADAEEASAQRKFEADNEKAAKEAYETVRREREETAKVAEQEMRRQQAEYERDQQNRRRREAAVKAEKERSSAEQYKQNAAKDSALDFFKGLQDAKRTSNSSGGSSSSGSNSGESINDRLARNLAEYSKHATNSKAVADSVDTGSSLVDRILGRGSSGSSRSYTSRNSAIKSFINNGGTWAEAEKKYNVSSSTISDILGHSAVPVFRRMSKEEYCANYSGLRWKRS